MSCQKFIENSCGQKVVVLAPGASDLSEGMACLHQGECPDSELQEQIFVTEVGTSRGSG